MVVLVGSDDKVEDIKNEVTITADLKEQDVPTIENTTSEKIDSAEEPIVVKEPELTEAEIQVAKEVIENPTVNAPEGATVSITVNKSTKKVDVPEAEMTNYLRGAMFTSNTNNSNLGSGLEVCIPGFLAKAIPIVQNYVSGSVGESTALAQIMDLHLTGDIEYNGYTVVTGTRGCTFKNVTILASGGKSSILTNA